MCGGVCGAVLCAPPSTCGALHVQSDKNRVIPRYIYESHVEQICSLSIVGTTLVSGSSDESIKCVCRSLVVSRPCRAAPCIGLRVAENENILAAAQTHGHVAHPPPPCLVRLPAHALADRKPRTHEPTSVRSAHPGPAHADAHANPAPTVRMRPLLTIAPRTYSHGVQDL